MHYGREFLSLNQWESRRASHLRATCARVCSLWGIPLHRTELILSITGPQFLGRRHRTGSITLALLLAPLFNEALTPFTPTFSSLDLRIYYTHYLYPVERCQ
jgi:hypothetical protein